LAAAKAGDTSISVAAGSNITVGDTLTVDTGERKELVKVTNVSIQAGIAPGGTGRGGGRSGRGGAAQGTIELAEPLKLDHASGVDVSDVGTGISFTPATKFPHTSGDAVQAMGSGVTLDKPLDNAHEYGSAVVNPQVTTAGYQGSPTPNQWFGGTLSTSAGSIALMDAGGRVVVDAIVFGSQQSSSSANGTIASPELATLEGDQSKGGCIVVAAGAGRGGFGRGSGTPTADATSRSLTRTSDGADTDNNCTDFTTQTATPGATNQRP
jgi:non-reducing end alpha-L-arabinofuranosidase